MKKLWHASYSYLKTTYPDRKVRRVDASEKLIVTADDIEVAARKAKAVLRRRTVRAPLVTAVTFEGTVDA